MFLPQRVREARHEAKLTQEALAERMTEIMRRRHPERWATKKLRPRQIIRWEQGENAPGPEFLEVLALATRKEIADFFGDDEDEELAALPSLDDVLRNAIARAADRAVNDALQKAGLR